MKIKVEEDTTILIPDASTSQTNSLYQSPAGNSFALTPEKNSTDSLKLIEAENKLQQVFTEYSGRIESFILMLDTLHEGIVLVNKTGETVYVNEIGTKLVSEINLCNSGANLWAYQELGSERKTVVNSDAGHSFHVRANNFFWNDEPCNIFLIVKQDRRPEAVSDTVTSSPLSEPFESLLSYVRLIAGHEANGKADEAAACAQMAEQTIINGEKLLGDLKSFIGLSQHQPALAQVSMQKVVGDVLKSMGPEIEDAGIEVSVSELPETMADKELIFKLVKHLVGNAVKFRNKSRKAVIDIGHDKSEGQYIFCVRDNGIGISKKHHEQVFNLFSTLNTPDEYPGNGVGLAICKKIVELHNGKIWVESLPGHGSNFYFKLNAKKQI